MYIYICKITSVNLCSNQSSKDRMSAMNGISNVKMCLSAVLKPTLYNQTKRPAGIS